MKQFLRFCVIGSLGFVVDAGTLQVLVFGCGVDPYLGRAVSFLLAASVTWALNRHYTFRATRRAGSGEWLRYVAIMLLGASLNYAVYALCISAWSAALQQPWIGVVCGSLAGLLPNFILSRKMFKTTTDNGTDREE